MDSEREGVESAEEVLFEIRRHAKMSFSSDSFREEVDASSTGGFLSYLSLRGVKRLREKWNEYKRPKTVDKRMSLFVSSHGEYVAIAVGNQITFLRKDDDYMEPTGIFISKDGLSVFTNGAWLEAQGILGAIDDMGTLFFIKSNGEVISRRTKSQLKLNAPVVDLIVQDGLNSKESSRGDIYFFTTDGLPYHVKTTEVPSAQICTVPTLNNSTEKRQFPSNVSCLDFYPDLSLVVLVSACSPSTESRDNAGSYSLYLLRMIRNSELEILFCSSQFEGCFMSSKGCPGTFASPKVAISPNAKYIAALDMTGCVDIFELDTEKYSLSCLCSPERQFLHMPNNLAHGSKDYLHDIVDISWWTDDILVLAKRNDIITMYSVVGGRNVVHNDPVFCMPVIERVKHCQGHIFVLEGRSSDGNIPVSTLVEDIDAHHSEHITSFNYNQLDYGKLCWRLMSLSGKSVSEMYTILISNQQYKAAMDFAHHHRLDKDEVYKAQWLQSEQGIQEINMFLREIKDPIFVLSECVEKVGRTEDIVKALISYGLCITDEYKFSDSETCDSNAIWDFRVIRLQLLQYRDNLETFVGIHMGRFSVDEYRKFRASSLIETAIGLAESGKIGALNLLFKRHPYSLSPCMLDILSAVPETVPVQSYSQLLPGRSPPSIINLRDADWVECEKMICFINNMPSGFERLAQIKTENILKHLMGFSWPAVSELSKWYHSRTRDIDNLSGQLDNCLTLVEFAYRKGMVELQQFHEDISYLHQLIYSPGYDEEFTMTIVEWEQLSDYEKFKMMLKGVKEELIVERLQEKAIPFMKKRFGSKSVPSENQIEENLHSTCHEQKESFLVRWLKEIAADNKLDICLAVIENGCGDHPVDGLFKDETEMIETALGCIYLCTHTDQWNLMAAILSKLPRKILREKGNKDFNSRYGSQGLGTPRFSFIRSQYRKPDMQSGCLQDRDSETPYSRVSEEHTDAIAVDDNLEKRIKIVEGHVEVGRLVAYYQVPKPINFFLGAQSDEKNVKQLLRLILSKFGRRQPGRSDNEWANMWRDMQCFQEKAFPFLDTEYMLTEYCRGLLKAGKFSLARNYLKGTGSIALSTEKAENLVIQAAREYFFSASSLSCSEIWKAKECLSLLLNSKNVQAEADIIDALTTRLPNLGVTLLPVQFRQIRNPMEIINTVISNHTGAYLNVEELIEIAKLLGLSSPDDIATVEEAIAREAAMAGDLQLAFDLCIVLAKKGHGPIWDLCAAIARGPQLDNMDTSSRKLLLGFALSYCDDESIGELLQAWKDVDIHMQCEKLMVLTRSCPPNFFVQGSSIIPLPVNSVQDVFDLREHSETVKHDSAFHQSGSNDQVHFKNIKDTLSTVGKELSTEDGINWDTLLSENRKVITFAALELPWLLELSRKEQFGKKTISGVNVPRKHYSSIRTQALINVLYWMSVNDIAASDTLIGFLAKSIMESPVTEEEDVLGCSFLLNLTDAIQGVQIIEEQLKQREGHQEMYSIMNMGMAYSSLQNLQKESSGPERRRNLLLHKFQEKNASLSSDKLDQIDEAHSTFWKEWKMKLEEQKHLADQARALEQMIPSIESDRFLSGDTEYIRSVVFSFIDSIKTEKKHILNEAVKLADTYGLNRTEVLLQFFGSALVSECWGNDDILDEISEFREDIVRCAKDVIDMISSVVYPEIDGHNKQRLSYIYGILSACYLHLRKNRELQLEAPSNKKHVHKLEPFQFYKVLEQECHRVSDIDDLNFKNIADLDDLNFDNFNKEVSSNIHETTVDILANMVRALSKICSDSEVTKGLISWHDVYKHHILDCLASLERRIEDRSMGNMSSGDLQSRIAEIEQTYDGCKKYLRTLPEAEKSYFIRRYCRLCISPNPQRSSDDSAWKDCLLVLLSFWIKMVDDEGFDGKNLAQCLKSFKRLLMKDRISADNVWRTLTDYISLAVKGDLTIDISSFFRAMIFSGCGFQSVAEVYSEVQDEKLGNLVELYLKLTEEVQLDQSRCSEKQQDLHHLLSSLGRLDGGNYTEDLKMIRSQVWEKLSAYSDDLQFENHLRVYALELMQSITGQNLTSLPAELVAEVKPWEAWENSYFAKNSSMNVTETREGSATSITSTLIALKSTQLVAAISPDVKITAENLLTLESTVSCFIHLSEVASSLSHLEVLQTVLEEWEVLFLSTGTEDKVTTAESAVEELNNWSGDEWDNEGWENLAEEELGKTEEKQGGSTFVHPLHACWMEIIRRLVGFNEPSMVIELLDRSSSKAETTGALLDEDEARHLYRLVVGTDCFMAMKMLLLLPYKVPQKECLVAIDAKIKEATFPNGIEDYELLTLALSSGVLKEIATDPKFGKVFSYICHLVGYLTRLSQEGLLKDGSDDEKGSLDRRKLLIFRKLLLPCFITELVESGQSLLAGFIVSRWMHTHSSLGLIDITVSSLRKYLEGESARAQRSDIEFQSCGSLVYSVSRLREKQGSLLQSAILALPSNITR